jgi:mono/diheme cytochrome c family protein
MFKLNWKSSICLTTFLMLTSQISHAVGPDIKAPLPQNSGIETAEHILSIKQAVFDDMSQSVLNGEKRFSQSCIYCHGYEGSGGRTKKLQGRTIAPEKLFKTITEGRRKGASVMPPWEKAFSTSERWELVAYIMSLSEK